MLFFLQGLPYYLMTFTEKKHQIHNGLEYAGRNIYRDDIEDEEFTEMCSKNMDECIKNFLIRILVISLCFVFMSSGPVYAFFYLDIKTTIIDVRIPCTEEGSNYEFFGNILIHLCISVFGFFAFVGLEITMEVFVGVMFLAPKLVEYEFRKMDAKIENNSFNELQVRLTLRNIIQQIMDDDK